MVDDESIIAEIDSFCVQMQWTRKMQLMMGKNNSERFIISKEYYPKYMCLYAMCVCR